MAQIPDHELKRAGNVGMLFLMITTAMVASSTLTMAFSSLKLDLKLRLGWDEPTIGRVAMLNNLGVGFVVHMGWLYDRAGTRDTLVLAAALKLIGLLGAAALVAAELSWPIAFGLCCMIEGQGTGAIIIVGQSQVMQHVQPPGKALACCKTAIGFGPALWGAVYAAWFAPRPERIYVAGAFSVLALAAWFAVVVPKPEKVADSKTVVVTSQKHASLRDVMMTLDAWIICGTASCIIWGSALLWTANLSTFAVAAGYGDTKTAIQTSFFIASAVMRLCAGTLLDALPAIRTETWTALFSGFMFLSSFLMYMSEGSAIRFAAVLAGGAWGAAATVDPVLCRSVGGPHQATLYSLGKVMGMVCSMIWVRQAANEAKSHTAAGEVNCLGAECFQNTWATVILICAPALVCTSVWAVKRTFPHRSHEHVE